MNTFSHTPVLLKETIDHLHLRTGNHVIDGTIGLGGHSEAILKIIGPTGKLLAFDQDEENLKRAKERLKEYEKQIFFVHANFSEMESWVKQYKFNPVSAILLDLGLSSPHIDEAERGFSFRRDGPLDMRFDRSLHLTAADILRNSSEKELSKIFWELGEETQARSIARKIVYQRKKKPFLTTRDLASILETPNRSYKIHPATRVFQALRMAVNQELEHLEKALHQGIKILELGGRFAVISYHSLEDRLVKNTFRHYTKNCICPQALPVCQCNFKKTLYLVSKKPIIPSGIEVSVNPRARSAKLRVAEKI